MVAGMFAGLGTEKTRVSSRRSKPKTGERKDNQAAQEAEEKRKCEACVVDGPGKNSDTASSAPFNREIELKWRNKAGMHSPCDLIVKTVFHCYNVHKFPFCSRSKYFGRVTKTSNGQSMINLEDMPGGSEAFEFIGNFCYGVPFDFLSSNVAPVLAAAYFLEMTDEVSGLHTDSNLITLGEVALKNYLSNCSDTLNIVSSCHELGVEDEHQILSRAIEAFSNFMMSRSNQGFKRVDLSPSCISECVRSYAIHWLPFPKTLEQNPTSLDIPRQRFKLIIDTIVTLLPSERSATPIHFLLQFLQTASVVLSRKDSMDKIYSLIALRFYEEVSSQELLKLSVNDVQAMFEKFMADSVQRHLFDPTKSRHAAARLLEDYLYDTCTSSECRTRLDARAFLHLASLIPSESRENLDGLYRSVRAFAEGRRVSLTGGETSEMGQLCQLLDPSRLSLPVQNEICAERLFPLTFVIRVLEHQKKELLREVQFWESKCEKSIGKSAGCKDGGSLQEETHRLQELLEEERARSSKLSEEVEQLNRSLSESKLENADMERRIYEPRMAKTKKSYHSYLKRMFLEP